MGKNETKNYVGGSGMDDMELDERDIQLMEESRKEGKKKLFIALGAIVLAAVSYTHLTLPTILRV